MSLGRRLAKITGGDASCYSLELNLDSVAHARPRLIYTAGSNLGRKGPKSVISTLTGAARGLPPGASYRAGSTLTEMVTLFNLC